MPSARTAGSWLQEPVRSRLRGRTGEKVVTRERCGFGIRPQASSLCARVFPNMSQLSFSPPMARLCGSRLTPSMGVTAVRSGAIRQAPLSNGSSRAARCGRALLHGPVAETGHRSPGGAKLGSVRPAHFLSASCQSFCRLHLPVPHPLSSSFACEKCCKSNRL